MDISNDKRTQALLQLIAKKYVKAEEGKELAKALQELQEGLQRLEDRVDGIQDVETYEGEYTVVPSPAEQTLSTANLLMEDDVTVKEIPFYEVSNTSGGSTVYIGSEIEVY